MIDPLSSRNPLKVRVMRMRIALEALLSKKSTIFQSTDFAQKKLIKAFLLSFALSTSLHPPLSHFHLLSLPLLPLASYSLSLRYVLLPCFPLLWRVPTDPDPSRCSAGLILRLTFSTLTTLTLLSRLQLSLPLFQKMHASLVSTFLALSILSTSSLASPHHSHAIRGLSNLHAGHGVELVKARSLGSRGKGGPQRLTKRGNEAVLRCTSAKTFQLCDGDRCTDMGSVAGEFFLSRT